MQSYKTVLRAIESHEAKFIFKFFSSNLNFHYWFKGIRHRNKPKNTELRRREGVSQRYKVSALNPPAKNIRRWPINPFLAMCHWASV